jgi:hypothetical protein
MGLLDSILYCHDAVNYPKDQQKQGLSLGILWQAMFGTS